MIDPITANDVLSVLDQNGWSAGSYKTALIKAFDAADGLNRDLLASVYPEIGECFDLIRYEGVAALRAIAEGGRP